MKQLTTRRPSLRLPLLLFLLLPLFAPGLLPTATAQQPSARAPSDPFGLRALPGFVEAEALGISLAADKLAVEITIEGPMLRFLAEMSRAADAELADALARLKTVRARIYDLSPEDLPRARAKANRAAELLAGRGWQRVVTVREEGTQTHLFFKTDGSRIQGLTALFVSPENQLGMINIAGEVDPEQIGRIARKLNIDVLEETLEEAPPP